MSYQELFNYMQEEHGLSLLENEMTEIERIVLKKHGISLDNKLAGRSMYKDVIGYLNKVTGTKFRYAKAHQRVIEARIKEGFTIEDFKAVIDTKSAQWLNSSMQIYLRPSTLFQASKMDGYLQESKMNIPISNDEKTTAQRAAETVDKFFRGS